MLFRHLTLPVLPLILVLLAGCALNTSPKPRYYLLEPLAVTGNSQPTEAGQTRLIILSAVHIPHYADRPQIVTAGPQHDYLIDEYHRWAERLDDTMQRVLQQNLSGLLPDTLVLQNNIRSSETDRLRLSVDILDFIADERTGMARLVAQWTVTRDHQIVTTRQTTHQIKVAGIEPAARVAALNEVLNELSRDIAEDLGRVGG